MIDRLLGEVGRRVRQADGVRKSDCTHALAYDADGPTRHAVRTEDGVQLRVFHEGRVGIVGAMGDDPTGLADAAIAAAVTGPSWEGPLPAPAPLPTVQSADSAVARAGPQELGRLGQGLYTRLEAKDRRVSVWVQSSAGVTRVVNTRGVVAQYDATLAGLGARVQRLDGETPVCEVHWSGAMWPTMDEVEALASEVQERFAAPAIGAADLPGRAVVCFAPRAVHALLRPLRAALRAEALFAPVGAPHRSPLAGEEMLGASLTVLDDPTVPGRPGTRPIDDEGVVTRRIPLIDRGRVQGWSADLATATVLGIPASGHAWRGWHGESRAVFHNMRFLPGAASRGELLTLAKDGLLVADLEPQAGNVTSGTFAVRVPWAYRVSRGEVIGRVDGVVLVGNLFGLLRQIVGIGATPQWIGAAEVPMLAIEGVGVRREGA